METIERGFFRIHSLADILFLLIILLFPNNIAALDPGKPASDYLTDTWTDAMGLPSNEVVSINQAPDGYLWIATLKGLVRFDGLKFTITPFMAGAEGEEKQNEPAYYLMVDSKGVMWVAGDSGLASYHWKTGEFQSFTAKDGLPRDRIRYLKEDLSGKLWITYFSSYVSRFDGKIFTHFGPKQGLTGKKINAIIERHNGDLLFGSRENGVFLYNHDTFKPYPVQGLGKDYLITMLEDQDGRLWLGTSNGLICIDEKKTIKYAVKEGLSDNYITALLQDHEHRIWVGTVKGLNRIKANADSTADFEGLMQTFTITGLMEDRENSLWVGTYQSGLKRLKDGKFKTFVSIKNLKDEMAVSLFLDRSGHIRIGTFSGRLFTFRSGQLLTTVSPPGFEKTAIVSIKDDSSGNLWLGSNGRGAMLFQPDSGTVIRHLTTNNGLADNLVTFISKDSQENTWFCTFDGISRFKSSTGAIESINASTGLAGKAVHNMFEDSNGDIYATADQGITIIDKGDISSRDYRYLLKGVSVTWIHKDGDIRWIATHGSGLIRLRKDSAVYYTTAIGLTTNFLYRFFEDSHGRFWMMSDSGLLRLEKQELNDFAQGSTQRITCTVYDASDGLDSPEFNNKFSANAAMKTADGELWFITSTGISIINPENIRINKVPPPVVIESVIVDGQMFTRPEIDRQYTLHKAEKITFLYTAPTFLSPSKVRFKYKLEGVNPNWVYSEPGQKREASYQHLEPGSYTFKVSACNAEGIWNLTGDLMSFTIKPRFYGSLWFKLLIFIFLAGLAVLASFLFKKYMAGKKAKSKRSALEQDFAGQCIKKLTRLMEVEKIYREEDLSLHTLAERLSLPPHQLSQLLNENLERSFSDYINSYRIEEAKEMLSSSTSAEKKIIVIAFDVGFNTKVAFYNAFKKFTGMTPSEFKKQSSKYSKD